MVHVSLYFCITLLLGHDRPVPYFSKSQEMDCTEVNFWESTLSVSEKRSCSKIVHRMSGRLVYNMKMVVKNSLEFLLCLLASSSGTEAHWSQEYAEESWTSPEPNLWGSECRAWQWCADRMGWWYLQGRKPGDDCCFDSVAHQWIQTFWITTCKHWTFSFWYQKKKLCIQFFSHGRSDTQLELSYYIKSLPFSV